MSALTGHVYCYVSHMCIGIVLLNCPPREVTCISEVCYEAEYNLDTSVMSKTQIPRWILEIVTVHDGLEENLKEQECIKLNCIMHNNHN